MIDSLFRILEDADRAAALAAAGVEPRGYVAGHAPPARAGGRSRGLAAVIEVLGEIAGDGPCPLPGPPADRRPPEEWGLELPDGVRLAEPMDYADFIALEAEARLVDHRLGGRAGGDLGAGRPVPDL